MKNKKKNKKIIFIGIILMIFIIISSICINIFKSEKNITLENEEELYTLGDGEEMTEEYLEKIKEYMNSYDEVVIHYNKFKNIYNKDGIFIERIYDKSFASKINLTNKTSETYDSTKLDESIIEPTKSDFDNMQTTFQEAFGFDYNNYNNVYDIFCEVAKTQGACPDKFVGSRLHTFYYDNFYEEYKQKYYFYKNENILNEINDYDEILNIKSKIILQEDGKGQEYISYIDTIIRYTKDDKIIEEVYETIIMLWDENNVKASDCDCGPDTDCNTGEDNGIDCEGDGDC